MKFQIYYPVTPFIVGQGFGDKRLISYYKENGIDIIGHNGQDLATLHGQEVYAAHDGVCEVQVDSKQGYGVVIRTEDQFDYKDGQAFFKSIYWHLISNIPVKTGQKIKVGDLIGYSDSTGVSTGDHLHFGLKSVGRNSNGVYYNLEEGNGYYAAIDPTPYYNGKFAKDISVTNIKFWADLKLGDEKPAVKQLQNKLQKLGYFPLSQSLTNYYGNITRGAVWLFQQDYVENLSWLERNIYKGKVFGPKSREALNRL